MLQVSTEGFKTPGRLEQAPIQFSNSYYLFLLWKYLLCWNMRLSTHFKRWWQIKIKTRLNFYLEIRRFDLWVWQVPVELRPVWLLKARAEAEIWQFDVTTVI